MIWEYRIEGGVEAESEEEAVELIKKSLKNRIRRQELGYVIFLKVKENGGINATAKG